MGSFVLSNVSICGILNFARRGKCSTLAVNEWRFSLLYQDIHGDWSSALYRFLNVSDFLLDVPEPLLPRPLLCLLLIKEGLIAFVVLAMPLLVVILSEGLMSCPESRPDPIGGSEPVSGTRDSGLGLFT